MGPAHTQQREKGREGVNKIANNSINADGDTQGTCQRESGLLASLL